MHLVAFITSESSGNISTEEAMRRCTQKCDCVNGVEDQSSFRRDHTWEEKRGGGEGRIKQSFFGAVCEHHPFGKRMLTVWRRHVCVCVCMCVCMCVRVCVFWTV